MNCLRTTIVAVVMLVLTIPASWAQTPRPQSTLWRVVVGDTDRMTVINSLERVNFPGEGQMFYVPACQPANSTPIYRLYNGPDHMDSLFPVEGYYAEWAEGCGWNPGTPLPGLSPLIEALNPSTGDHALARMGEALPGYTVSKPLGVLGYQRFGNSEEVLLNLKGRTVSVDSNLVAGGNTWHWTWNGLQYLNLAGYPRGMHGEMFASVAGGDAEAYESGDGGSFFPDSAANIHGAPLVAAFNYGSKQVTLAVPLEFSMDSWGGDVDHPVVWQDLVFGKELTLNFNGDSSAARYRTYLYYPAPGNPEVGFSIPAIYLRGIFTRYFTYDAPTDALTEITEELDQCAAEGTPFTFTAGGLIASDATGAYAFGVYGADPSIGGSVSSIAIRPRICPGNGGFWENPAAENSYSTVVIRPWYIGAVTQEISTFNSYIVTNTLDNVRRSMRKLYQTGVR